MSKLFNKNTIDDLYNFHVIARNEESGGTTYYYNNLVCQLIEYIYELEKEKSDDQT